MTKARRNSVQAAERVFKARGGILRTAEAIRAGVHPRTLYQMRDDGILERLERGLYRLANLPPLSQPDLTTVAAKIPSGVICFVTALSFHGMTTQIPRAVDVALLRGSSRPRIHHPPIRVYYFSPLPFREGIEVHEIDSVAVRVFSREKTLADCFKYRRKLGMDIVLEALGLYTRSGRTDMSSLFYYARVCRVEKIMRPYLETILQ